MIKKNKNFTPETLLKIITDQIEDCKIKKDTEGIARLATVYCRVQNILARHGFIVDNAPKITFVIEGLDESKI